MSRAGAWRVAVPLAALVPLLLALGRPITIDDVLFLKSATQALSDPLHPLDGSMNWFGEPQPFWSVFPNPPALGYWLAAVEAFGGTSEWALHLSLLPFAVAAALAGGRLARRFAGNSPWAAMLWLASPAFLVSASTIMADVPSLAVALWGLALWIEGVDADRAGVRASGALLAGVAVLVKYTALLTVPTLALYALLARAPAPRWRRLADLWPALLPAAVWSLWTLATAGRLHMVDSLFLIGSAASPNAGWTLLRWALHRGIALFTFVAASGVFPLFFVVPALGTLSGRSLVLLAAVVGFGASLAAPFLWLQPGLPDRAPAIVGLLAAFGAAALLVAVEEALGAARKSEDRDEVFLAGWVFLNAAFAWFGTWTIAARFVLPLLPPLALLLARALARRPAGERLLAGATAVGAVVATLVLLADASAGEFHRRALPAIATERRREGHRAYFVGAWGFQYYAERAGMERLGRSGPRPRAGDIVLQPYYASSNDLPDALIGRIEKAADVAGPPPFLGIHTMNPFVGAGFYASVFGPLPFTLSLEPAEGMIVWKVTRERARDR